MRLSLRPLVRWFRLNIDSSERLNPGAGNGSTTGTNDIKVVVREKKKKCEEDTPDLLKELCAVVSSSARKSDVIPSASSRSKLLQQQMHRLQSSNSNREVRFASTGLFSHAEVILDTLGSLNPEDRLDEVLEKNIDFVLTDEVVSKVILGTQGLDVAISFFEWACKSRDYRPGVLAYDCLVQILVKTGNVDAAYRKFREVLEIFLVPSSFSYGILIHALGAEGDAEKALMLFKEMNRGSSGEANVVKCLTFLITGLCKSGKVADAKEQYRKWKNDVRLNVVVYNALIEGLVRNKLVADAVEVFKEMSAAFCQPNGHTYSALISGLCKSGKVLEACEFFDQMLEKEFISPHVVLYTTLIDGLCKTRKFDKACSILEKMENPDIVTYSALIDGLCSIGRVDYAHELLEQITDRGSLKPDVILYNIFIKGLCKAGQLENALDLFSKMGKNGYSPNTVTYNTLMRGLCWQKRVEDARKLFKEMIAGGCEPDSATYMIISEVFLRNPSVEDARKLVEEVREECKDTSSVVDAPGRISELCKAGNVEEAYRIFQTIFEVKQLQPGVDIYASLVCGFLQEGKFLQVDQLVKDMLRRGCSPTYEIHKAVMVGLRRLIMKQELSDFVDSMVTEMAEKQWIPDALLCNSLVEGLCEADHPVFASELVKQVSKKERLIRHHLWDTLIQRLCRSRKMRMALEMIQQAAERGCELHPLTHLAMIRGLLGGRLLREAVKQFRQMVANSRYCTKQMAVMHGRINTSLCRRGRWKEAFELQQEMVKRGLLPTKKSFNNLVQRECAIGRLESAEQLRQQMQQIGMQASRKTFSLLVDGYCQQAKLQEACAAVQEMIYCGFRPTRRNYRTLVAKLCEAGLMEDGFQVLQKMVLLGKPLPHLFAFNAVFQGFYAAGRLDEARRVFQEMLRCFTIDFRRKDFPIQVEQLRKIFEIPAAE